LAVVGDCECSLVQAAAAAEVAPNPHRAVCLSGRQHSCCRHGHCGSRTVPAAVQGPSCVGLFTAAAAAAEVASLSQQHCMLHQHTHGCDCCCCSAPVNAVVCVCVCVCSVPPDRLCNLQAGRVSSACSSLLQAYWQCAGVAAAVGSPASLNELLVLGCSLGLKCMFAAYGDGDGASNGCYYTPYYRLHWVHQPLTIPVQKLAQCNVMRSLLPIV